MARPSDEFAIAWRALASDANQVGWLTIPVTPAGGCELRAGRRSPGNAEVMLARFPAEALPPAEKLPSGQGFNVERADPFSDGAGWIALTRAPAGNPEVFLAMARDVAETLDAAVAEDASKLLRRFLGRVRAWQEFMRKGAPALGPEAEIGLFGELALLMALLDAGIDAPIALRAWEGPFDGLQDFEIGSGAIECKTTLSTAGFPARIGSLQQLDDAARQPLFVAATRLSMAVGGASLPALVAQARARLAGDAESGRLLSDRLLAACYFDMHADRYSRTFGVAARRIMEVGAGFPRMTPGTVPPGILAATYDIDLALVGGPGLGLADALKKLGAL